MRKRLLKLITTAAMFFCVATCLAQMIIVGVVWLKGGLTETKRQRILAVAYGIDLVAMHQAEKQARDDSDAENSPESRVMQSTELIARTASFRTSQLELLGLEGRLQDEKRKSRLRIIDFDNLLGQLENEAREEGLLEVRRTLEVMQTKQARTQLLRMLDDGAMDDVVKMVKAMPVTKRKKILSEFKSPDDAERLHEVLRQLREVAARGENRNAGQPRS